MPPSSARSRELAAVAAFTGLGILVAALPDLVGVPESERSGLRGLGVAFVAFLVAAAIVARWASLPGPRAGTHSREVARLLLAALLIGAPSSAIGLSWDSVGELILIPQIAVGWARTVPGIALLALFLTGVWSSSRLIASLRRHRIQGGLLIGCGAGAAFGLAVAGANLLLRIPAPIGFERFEKLALLLLLAVLSLAALAGSGCRGSAVDPRALALGVGSLTAGWALWLWSLAYVHPSVHEIQKVLQATGTSNGTVLGTAVAGRPDLWAIFAMENASSTPRLAFVRPVEPSMESAAELPVRWKFGFARLEPSPIQRRAAIEESRRQQLLLDDENRSYDVWFRSPIWPWLDLRSGVRLPATVLDWELLPPGATMVSTIYVPPLVKPFYGDVCGLAGTFRVIVSRPLSKPIVLLDELPLAPTIFKVEGQLVWLVADGNLRARGRLETRTASAVLRLPRPSQFSNTAEWAVVPATTCAPTPSYFGVTKCNLGDMSCEPWSTPEMPSTSTEPVMDRYLVRRGASWMVVDPRSARRVYSSSPLRDVSGDSDRAYLRRDGGAVRISLLGRMPDWEMQLRAYDPVGVETAFTSLGRVRLAKFAGELSGDLVAIAWRSEYVYRGLAEPTPGWTLDSWNVRTGVLRRLADGVASLPGSEHGSSFVFLDTEGFLISPTESGVRRITRLRGGSG